MEILALAVNDDNGNPPVRLVRMIVHDVPSC
jgi:hypothetical protein